MSRTTKTRQRDGVPPPTFTEDATTGTLTFETKTESPVTVDDVATKVWGSPLRNLPWLEVRLKGLIIYKEVLAADVDMGSVTTEVTGTTLTVQFTKESEGEWGRAHVRTAYDEGMEMVKADTSVRKDGGSAAFAKFREAAAEGDVRAIVRLADIISKGDCGIDPDEEEAYALYKRAADAPYFDTIASFHMGYYHHNGAKFCPKDFALADKYYRQATERASMLANFNLGLLHKAGGHGIKADVGLAIEFWEKSMELGSANAAFNIAIMHMKELAPESDMRVAMEFFAKAKEMDPTIDVPTFTMAGPPSQTAALVGNLMLGASIAFCAAAVGFHLTRK